MAYAALLKKVPNLYIYKIIESKMAPEHSSIVELDT